MSQVVVSQQTGYARNASESAYPNLWRGLVGWWCPSINPRGGNRLFDLSPFRNHGTLTNMTNDDWVVSSGGGALDFDGTTDHVAFTCPVAALQFPFTVSLWYYPRTRVQYAGLVSTMTAFSEASTNGWLLYDGSQGNAGRIGIISGGTRVVTATNNSTLNIWQHYSGVFNGTNSSIYKNGAQVISGTLSSPSYSATPVIKIGAYVTTNGFTNSLIDCVMLHNRALTPSEIRLLASKRGIGLERTFLRRLREEVAVTGVAKPVLFYNHYVNQGFF